MRLNHLFKQNAPRHAQDITKPLHFCLSCHWLRLRLNPTATPSLPTCAQKQTLEILLRVLKLHLQSPSLRGGCATEAAEG